MFSLFCLTTKNVRLAAREIRARRGVEFVVKSEMIDEKRRLSGCLVDDDGSIIRFRMVGSMQKLTESITDAKKDPLKERFNEARFDGSQLQNLIA